MDRKRRGPAAGDGRKTSGLSRLVATEESLEERVRRAHEQAAGILEQARQAAAAARERLENDLAPATRELLASITAEAEVRVQALETERAKQVAAYENVTGEKLDELARTVVGRVIGESSDAVPP